MCDRIRLARTFSFEHARQEGIYLTLCGTTIILCLVRQVLSRIGSKSSPDRFLLRLGDHAGRVGYLKA